MGRILGFLEIYVTKELLRDCQTPILVGFARWTCFLGLTPKCHGYHPWDPYLYSLCTGKGQRCVGHYRLDQLLVGHHFLITASTFIVLDHLHPPVAHNFLEPGLWKKGQFARNAEFEVVEKKILAEKYPNQHHIQLQRDSKGPQLLEICMFFLS